MAEKRDTTNIPDNENIVEFQDESGNNVYFEFIDLILYKGKEYVVLFPADQVEDGEVVILETLPVEGDPDMMQYVSVENEEILNALFEIFKEKFKDQFNFIEEE